jgi:hypothetical protein
VAAGTACAKAGTEVAQISIDASAKVFKDVFPKFGAIGKEVARCYLLSLPAIR